MRCPWQRGRARGAKTAADRRGPSPGDRGRAGEQLAARYLAGHGLRILAQNWRFRGGEIDLVAEDGGDLVIVEVKMRAGGTRRELPLGQLDRLARHAPRLASTFGRTESAVVRIDIVWVESEAGDRLGRVAEWMRGVDPETGAALGPEPPRPSWWRRARSRLRFLSSGRRFQKGGRSRDPIGP